jgi:hypothetical protein
MLGKFAPRKGSIYANLPVTERPLILNPNVSILILTVGSTDAHNLKPIPKKLHRFSLRQKII